MSRHDASRLDNTRQLPHPHPVCLIGLVAGTLDPDRAASDRTLVIDGAAADLQLLMSLVAPVDPDFVIVTP